jgi:hypothetical protein
MKAPLLYTRFLTFLSLVIRGKSRVECVEEHRRAIFSFPRWKFAAEFQTDRKVYIFPFTFLKFRGLGRSPNLTPEALLLIDTLRLGGRVSFAGNRRIGFAGWDDYLPSYIPLASSGIAQGKTTMKEGRQSRTSKLAHY